MRAEFLKIKWAHSTFVFRGGVQSIRYTCGCGWRGGWRRACQRSSRNWCRRPSRLRAGPCPIRVQKRCEVTRRRTSAAKSTRRSGERRACLPSAISHRWATGWGRSCPAPAGWHCFPRHTGSTPPCLSMTKQLQFDVIQTKEEEFRPTASASSGKDARENGAFYLLLTNFSLLQHDVTIICCAKQARGKKKVGREKNMAHYEARWKALLFNTFWR